MEKKVFLLGGKDLEMNEIEKILEKQENCKVFNNDLSWGAKLSDYNQEIEKYKDDENTTIYAVELEEDLPIPQNYVQIDHHGKNDYKPSSLEQIAEILNIELSREQKLIAANDSRYISGMKNLCATKEEIEDIRKRDREIQGVTPKDEELAKESIEESNDKYIYSKTPFFSAISDKVYFKFQNYVIFNDTKIVFHGYKKQNILDFLKSKNIKEEDYYYGGGEFGFVGVKDKVLSEEQIKNLVENFKEPETKEDIYSYHTFMFPFTFEGVFCENKNWTHKFFEIEQQKDFNEFVYFYKHVQDAIYNLNEKENKDKYISNYYEYKEQKGTYTINCKKGIFDLELDGISLRTFNTKVGILSFNIKNTKYKDKEDVLAINDFGRRIYPQYLGEKYTENTKDSFLANCITLTFQDKRICDNFTKFDKENFENLKNPKELNLLPKFISELIEENFKQKEKIRPIIDDRMFVISQYMNDDLVSKLQTFRGSDEYEYETNDDWYKYVFVDGDSKTCQSKNMTKKLIAESTYDRWVDWGTLFGISRYSFVALTGESWFCKNIIFTHMQTMYFQMFSLLLAYRASIIKFSDDIQDITKENNKELPKKADELYYDYLKFLNKLYFKEITAQDQGVELYNQAMKVMDIEKYMNDLNHEINQLHSFVSMKEEKTRNEKLDFISKLGAVLLPPSLLAGILGMNVLTFDETLFNQNYAMFLIILSGVIGYLFVANSSKKRFCFSTIIFPILFVLFLGLFTIFEKKDDKAQEVEIKNQAIEVIISNKKEKNE